MRKPNDVCSVCECPIYRRPNDKARYKKGYCSNHKSVFHSKAAKVLHKKKYELYIERWKAGEVNGMRGSTAISAHIKRYMIQKYGEKCSVCGWAETNVYTRRIPLEMNHKDGDFRNNNEENLELLCPNHHSLTAHFRGRNRGRGRPRRG